MRACDVCEGDVVRVEMKNGETVTATVVDCLHHADTWTFWLAGQRGHSRPYTASESVAPKEKEPASHLTLSEAIDHLDGHTVLSVEGARMVCLTLGSEIDLAPLTLSWETRAEAYQKYGFIASAVPGTGIDGLELAWKVVAALGMDYRTIPNFAGRGYQSRAIQQAIRHYMVAHGRLDKELNT